MSDLEKVIAQMRQYVHRDDDGHECRASGHTLTSWANTLERLIQQPEQGSEGRDSSDESGVQSAAIETEIYEAESAWCRCYRKLQMYIDEDQSVDSDFSRIYAAFSKIRCSHQHAWIRFGSTSTMVRYRLSDLDAFAESLKYGEGAVPCQN